jgi:hypothetical protein
MFSKIPRRKSTLIQAVEISLFPEVIEDHKENLTRQGDSHFARVELQPPLKPGVIYSACPINIYSDFR